MKQENMTYRPIPESSVPHHLIFDVPRQNQGQMVEVAEAAVGMHGGLWRALYRRVTDEDNIVTYYRLADSP